ncbi:MAG: Arc family DNA-binding protein [Aeromonas sp.]
MNNRTTPTSRNSDKFVLRLPDGMREKIAEQAKANGRSMNAEIVYHLQKAMDGMMGEPPIQDTMINVDPDMTNTVDMYAAIDPDFARVIHALIQYQQIKSGKC